MTVELDGFLCGVDAHDNYSNTYKIFFFHFLFLFDGCLEFGMPYTFLKIDRNKWIQHFWSESEEPKSCLSFGHL